MPLLISYCDSIIKQVGHDAGAVWCNKNEHKGEKNGDLDVETELDGRDNSER